MTVNSKRVAVVTGGLSENGALDSTEFLNVELSEKWEIGKFYCNFLRENPNFLITHKSAKYFARKFKVK